MVIGDGIKMLIKSNFIGFLGLFCNCFTLMDVLVMQSESELGLLVSLL